MRSATSLLSGLLAPPRCAACARPCGSREALCERCERRLTLIAPPFGSGPPGLDAAWSSAPYEGVARELVSALKFRRLLPVAERIAVAVASRAPAGLIRGTLIPVPAAPARRRARGFDPAEEIARALSRLTRLELHPCLERADGPRQVGRPRPARLSDPPRVSVARTPPARVLLVDDVWTTGATLAACARALRQAGAERVSAATFARSL
jgi:ComF family protein